MYIIVGCNIAFAFSNSDNRNTYIELNYMYLDSFMLELKEVLEFSMSDSTILKIVSEQDSIREYQYITDLFSHEYCALINRIEVHTSASRMPKKNNGRYKSSSSYSLYKIGFKDISEKKENFTNIRDDIFVGRNVGKIMFKAGGIIFWYKKALFLIPINACTNSIGLNKVGKIIDKYVDSDWVKFKCGGDVLNK